MFRIGETVRFTGAFYDVNGEDYVPDDASIVVKPPYDPEVSMVALPVGGNLYYADLLLEGTAGLWLYKFESTDMGAINNAWQGVMVETLQTAPTLNELHDALRATGVTLVSPVTQDGTLITVVQGDDYLEVDGRQLEWEVGNIVDLTGATVTLYIKSLPFLPSFEKVATVNGQTVKVELTSVETNALTVDQYSYALRALLDSGSIVTLVQGKLKVRGTWGGC